MAIAHMTLWVRWAKNWFAIILWHIKIHVIKFLKLTQAIVLQSISNIWISTCTKTLFFFVLQERQLYNGLLLQNSILKRKYIVQYFLYLKEMNLLCTIAIKTFLVLTVYSTRGSPGYACIIWVLSKFVGSETRIAHCLIFHLNMVKWGIFVEDFTYIICAMLDL